MFRDSELYGWLSHSMAFFHPNSFIFMHSCSPDSLQSEFHYHLFFFFCLDDFVLWQETPRHFTLGLVASQTEIEMQIYCLLFSVGHTKYINWLGNEKQWRLFGGRWLNKASKITDMKSTTCTQTCVDLVYLSKELNNGLTDLGYGTWGTLPRQLKII